jgi:hypothetical protein
LPGTILPPVMNEAAPRLSQDNAAVALSQTTALASDQGLGAIEVSLLHTTIMKLLERMLEQAPGPSAQERPISITPPLIIARVRSCTTLPSRPGGVLLLGTHFRISLTKCIKNGVCSYLDARSSGSGVCHYLGPVQLQDPCYYEGGGGYPLPGNYPPWLLHL